MSYKIYTIDEIKKIIDDNQPFKYNDIINYNDIGNLPIDYFAKFISSHSYTGQLNNEQMIFIWNHKQYISHISDYETKKTYRKMCNLCHYMDMLYDITRIHIDTKMYEFLYDKLTDTNQVIELLQKYSISFETYDNYIDFMLIHMKNDTFRQYAKEKIEHKDYEIIKIL